MFRNLESQNLRQLRSIALEFHPRLTVLTGANGTGKTSLLNILNRHFDWNLVFTSTPRLTRKGEVRFSTGGEDALRCGED